MIDPRLAVIEKRLSPVARILIFASGKGGVGKSLCATVAALTLSSQGYRTGLFDLDFQGASAHIFLGVEAQFPKESHGLLPLQAAGDLQFMSVAAFSGERPVPMRGEAVSNALIELLTVTVWSNLDFLIVDMPPGIGDEAMDMLRFMKRSEIAIVSTPSVVSTKVAGRLLRVCLDFDMTVVGIVENMARGPSASQLSQDLAQAAGVPLLGSIPYFDDVEQNIGSPRALLQSPFGLRMRSLCVDFFS